MWQALPLNRPVGPHKPPPTTVRLRSPSPSAIRHGQQPSGVSVYPLLTPAEIDQIALDDKTFQKERDARKNVLKKANKNPIIKCEAVARAKEDNMNQIIKDAADARAKATKADMAAQAAEAKVIVNAFKRKRARGSVAAQL